MDRLSGKCNDHPVPLKHGAFLKPTAASAGKPQVIPAMDYLAVFASAFLAATLLPAASEAVLAGASTSAEANVLLLLGVASVGNTLGSVVNWLLGRLLWRWREHRWFPATPASLDRASAWFRRFGVWSLLFAWLPLVGDPLTLAAGVLRVNFLPFLVLVTLGKTARYAVVLGVVEFVVG
jgi:membrane protein YqaA with SNARE-associated domain